MKMIKTIRQIMTKEVISLNQERFLREAVDLMTKYSISCIVITEGDKPVGIITERDMVKKVLKEGVNIDKVQIKSFMSSPLISVSPEIDIFSAAEIMKNKKIRRLVIIKDGYLGGLITQNDIGKLITDVSLRSVFHKMNLQKDLEIARLQAEVKKLKNR